MVDTTISIWTCNPKLKTKNGSKPRATLAGDPERSQEYPTAEGRPNSMFKVRKIVDLSFTLAAGIPIYPGDPVPTIEPVALIEQEGFNVAQLSLGSHSGTHIDAPYHFFAQGERIDQINLHGCLGSALIVDVSRKQPLEAITLQDLAAFRAQFTGRDMVLLRTDWSKYWGSETYFRHPFLSREAGAFLFEQGIRTLGIDALNVDQTGQEDFYTHDLFLGAGGLIVENLTNLAAVDFDHPMVSVLPLKLAGCDGSPVRAVAFDLTADA